jgi:signal transduction histidine kinase/CheY-like chemotaxis protein
MHHQLIQRQIRKYLSEDAIKDPSLENFINAISDSYCNYERDKELNEHAFALNEEEFEQINIKLKNEIESRKKAIDNLIDAVQKLDAQSDVDLENVHNLDDIITYLKHLIVKKNETEIELILARDIAERAAMARSEFLSMMSHEIRTPLNAVVGTTYLLLQDNPQEHQEKYLNMLKFSAENLMLLINDILDFNKIESGKIELEKSPFLISKLITQVKNTNQNKAKENETRLRVMIDNEIPATLIGDSLRLGQILTNLVSNAVKFTKKGFVIIQCLVIEKTEEAVTIKLSVEDNGIGIAKENQEKIFDKFIQASDSTTREFGGTGLGLAITKKLVEVMGGDIKLQSEFGKGSTFSFNITVPYINEENQEEKKISDSIQIFDLTNVKVLLVEYNEFNSIIASTFLSNWHAEVDLAWNGKEAINKVLSKPFDIVLMDLHMPVMNGYDAAKEIVLLNPKLPVLALTASAMLSIKDKAYECGMVDYITKPFNPSELYEKIKKYTSSKYI